MPDSSLGCGCAIEVCVPCFLQDYQIRKKPYFVNEHGVSKWDDGDELFTYLVNLFEDKEEFTQANKDEKCTAFRAKHFYIRKPCAVCCTTVLWNLDELPAINPVTRRITMFAPMKRVQRPFPTGPEL